QVTQALFGGGLLGLKPGLEGGGPGFGGGCALLGALAGTAGLGQLGRQGLARATRKPGHGQRGDGGANQQAQQQEGGFSGRQNESPAGVLPGILAGGPSQGPRPAPGEGSARLLG